MDPAPRPAATRPPQVPGRTCLQHRGLRREARGVLLIVQLTVPADAGAQAEVVDAEQLHQRWWKHL